MLELHEKVGSGAFGTVYRGYGFLSDSVDRFYKNEKVAIKIWNHEPTQHEMIRFKREVYAGLSVDHPNCIHFYGYSYKVVHDPVHNCTSNYPVVVMEYAGAPLSETNLQHLTNVQKHRYLWEVAEGLFYLHLRGYIHRDIKVDVYLLSERVVGEYPREGRTCQDIGLWVYPRQHGGFLQHDLHRLVFVVGDGIIPHY